MLKITSLNCPLDGTLVVFFENKNLNFTLTELRKTKLFETLTFYYPTELTF